MQLVLVCGGTGRRLRPLHHGPKSMLELGGNPLVARLARTFRHHHRSVRPPVVIVDARDTETAAAVSAQLPRATVVRQARPDGVANALLLAEPFLDDLFLVVLGDLFLDGTIGPLPHSPALITWSNASPLETRKNFGVAIDNSAASAVTEKPRDTSGLECGIGAYVLDRPALDSFRHATIDPVSGERGITSAIQAAIDRGTRFRCVAFSGYYNNINTPQDAASVATHLGVAAS